MWIKNTKGSIKYIITGSINIAICYIHNTKQNDIQFSLTSGYLWDTKRHVYKLKSHAQADRYIVFLLVGMVYSQVLWTYLCLLYVPTGVYSNIKIITQCIWLYLVRYLAKVLNSQRTFEFIYFVLVFMYDGKIMLQ